MKTISISEVKERLNRTDLRSVRGWCKKNDVFIGKQGGYEYVFETNFKEVIERPFINKLKKEFGDEWESVYRLHAEGNIPALNMLQDIPSVRHKAYKSKHKGKNEFEEEFDKYVKIKAA